MSERWKPSTQTTRYDRERVERLKPVEEAVQGLGLPISRLRKLNAILNAIEVQIETGGDSPEVTRLLLDALRAGLDHQVGEAASRGVLSALDTFEMAESERWALARSSNLPPIPLTQEERLADLIDEGEELRKGGQITTACDRWLLAWELVKEMITPAVRSTHDFDTAYGLMPLVCNWASDLELELNTAGYRNPVYHEHRLRYAREFLARFPGEGTLTLINFYRAEAEALARLGRGAEAEAVFAALVERFPDEGVTHMAWSDYYWLEDESARDYDRARAILQSALARPTLNYRDELKDRLAELEARRATGRDQVGAATLPKHSPPPLSIPAVPVPSNTTLPATRLGRNDRCWCGSGKKYKNCHLREDQQGRA
jgi:hypothetical protein